MNIYEALKYYYNYDSFRNNQSDIVNSLLNSNNTIAILPTGGGKSICFQIPALLTDGLCIVVTPLISLMNDQVYELSKYNIKATLINSTLTSEEINDIYNDLSIYKFLYVSPERLEQELFIKSISNIKLSYIIIDEAHCIETWGSSFRTSYQRIINFTRLHNVTIGCFTATSTITTLNKIVSLLDIKKYNLFQTSLSRGNLMFDIIKTNKKMNYLIKYLNINKVTIVYCSTVKTVEYLYSLLKDRYNITIYHGRLDQYNRNKNQNAFIKGKINIIIATNAFGMGINKSDVRYVIHYEVSGSIEDYYQEAGRAGRDIKASKCIILYDNNDLDVHYYQRDKLDKKNYYKKTMELIHLNKYLKTKKCLESNMKIYFNEKASNCNRCSNCLKKNYKLNISNILLNFDKLKEIYNISENNLFLLEEAYLLIKKEHFNYKQYLIDNTYFIKLIYNKKTFDKLLRFNKEMKKIEKINILSKYMILKLICLNPNNYIHLTNDKKILVLLNKYKNKIDEIVNNLEKKTI